MKTLIYMFLPILVSMNGLFVSDSATILIEKRIEEKCEAPMKLKAVEITSNSALLDWKGPLREYYQIEWGSNGFKRGEGTESNSNIRKLQIDGLAPDTPYDYYVRGNCGGTEFTEWTGPYTFVTGKPKTE